jgi:hypothetical protein
VCGIDSAEAEAQHAIPRLKIVGCQSGVFGNSSEDSRAEFLIVVVDENNVLPIRTRQRAVSPIDA